MVKTCRVRKMLETLRDRPRSYTTLSGTTSGVSFLAMALTCAIKNPSFIKIDDSLFIDLKNLKSD